MSKQEGIRKFGEYQIKSWYAADDGYRLTTIRPTTWRKLVGIRQGRKKREELKQEAIALINNQFSINVNDDEAEAILIGKAAFLL